MSSFRKKLKQIYNKATVMRLKVKSLVHISRNNRLDNIYYATIQKTGSQWLKAILDDKRIRKFTKLETYPQHDYDGDQFHKKFPKGTFVPGLYFSYQTYSLYLDKSKNYKTIYIIRDPRNIVVSWYYSVLKTHGESKQIKILRDKLKLMSFEEGINYSIMHLGEKFSQMRSWLEIGKNDANVIFFKFEDLISDPINEFSRLFEFLNYNIDSALLKEVLDDYSKNKMRLKDLEKRKGTKDSHYRENKTDYKEVFTEDQLKLFYKNHGNLIEVLGY